MVCAQCGKENPEGARFCAFCGGVPSAPRSTPVRSVPVRTSTTSMPVPRASSRLPLVAAVSGAVVVAGSLIFAASRLGPVRGALGALTGQRPQGSGQVAQLEAGSVPGAPGSAPPLEGSPWAQNAPGVQTGMPGSGPGGGLVTPGTPGANAPGGPAGSGLTGGSPANAPWNAAGSVTAAGPSGTRAGGSVSATTPGGVAPGAAITGASPGTAPAGARVVAGSPGSLPDGRPVTGASPGSVASGRAVTGASPGGASAAPPVTAGRAGGVPAGPPVTGVQPGSVPAGRGVVAGQPSSAPAGRSVAATPPPSVPAGRGVAAGVPSSSQPSGGRRRRRPAPAVDPRQQERDLVAEYLRRLERIQSQDNQLNQQIGGLGGGWMESANGLQGLENPGQFMQQYGGIMQGFGRVTMAKQNVGNLFLNTCGPIARACPPVQSLHNWYTRYFQEWIQATQMLTGALQNRNLGMAMQVQNLLGRAETTQQQCQREEDRVRDRYDISLSPFGPR